MRTLFTLLLLLPLATACASGPSKSELDAEVKRLCAIDGGIKVYETVMLPPERFDKFGNMRITLKEQAKQEDEYYLEWESHYYHKGNPEMWRDHIRVIRRNDGKIMGEAIGYSRRGGDLSGPWHESSFRCPQVWNLEPLIFKNQEKK